MSLKVIKFFLFLNYLLFIFFFIGEISLRIFTPEKLKVRMEINNLTHKVEIQKSFDEEKMVFQKNSVGLVKTTEFEHTVSIDSIGYRKSCLDNNKLIGNILVGDSFAFGIGVKDKETAVCIFNNHSKDNMYNISVPGASITQYFQLINKVNQIKNNLNLKKNIKMHLLFYTGNDFLDLINYKEENTQTTGKAEHAEQKEKNSNYNQSSFLHYLNKKLHKYKIFRNSYTINFFKLHFLQFRKSNILESHFYNYLGDIFLNKNFVIDEDALFINLNKFIIKANEVEIDFGNFIILPSANEISYERYIRDANIAGVRYNSYDPYKKLNTLKEICDKKKLPCLFTDNIFSVDDYYVGDGHLNKKGQRKLGLFLAEKIN